MVKIPEFTTNPDAETVQLSGPGFNEDDTVAVSEGNGWLVIETPDWMMSDMCPIHMYIENAFVHEVGGKEVILKAFAAFVSTLDNKP